MNATMETIREYKLVPTFGDSYGTGWKVMMDNFLRLLLVVFVLAILTGPMKGLNFNFKGDEFKDFPWKWEGDWGQLFGLASLGAFAVIIGMLALAYTFLALPVVRYGAKMIFVESVRKIKPDFEWLIRGFWTNYLNIILANLLVFALVAIGLFALLVPGIIIACRLAFVPYIVMDKKLDPIESVELELEAYQRSRLDHIPDGICIILHLHFWTYSVICRYLSCNNVGQKLICIALSVGA